LMGRCFGWDKQRQEMDDMAWYTQFLGAMHWQSLIYPGTQESIKDSGTTKAHRPHEPLNISIRWLVMKKGVVLKLHGDYVIGDYDELWNNPHYKYNYLETYQSSVPCHILSPTFDSLFAVNGQ
jgi:hypothetical protein